MTQYRARKIAGIAREIPPTEVDGDPEGGELLVLGWGSTYGAIRTAVERHRERGNPVSRVHLRWLNPLPPDLGDVLKRFRQVLIPELNCGQLWTFIRAQFLVPAVSFNKVQGLPFTAAEIEEKIELMLAGTTKGQ